MKTISISKTSFRSSKFYCCDSQRRQINDNDTAAQVVIDSVVVNITHFK